MANPAVSSVAIHHAWRGPMSAPMEPGRTGGCPIAGASWIAMNPAMPQINPWRGVILVSPRASASAISATKRNPNPT